MRHEPRIAAVYPPGEFLREELEARGWSQRDLAQIMGRPLQMINEIINARKRITPETAVELSAALGTSAEFWLNIETAYRLSMAPKPNPAIARRAQRKMAATHA